jgi:pyruvate formate lyase activating enzyme
MKNVTGYLHSVETAGTLDGPGIRRVLFLSGCPLNCQYCHNPDARAYKSGCKTDSYTELREIAKNRDVLQKLSGGVTLSGGEPLSQPAFTKSIFEGCKLLGLHTALDTSGYLGHKADDELLSYTDLVLLDIKAFDPERYRKVTDVELQPTLDFARRLSEMKKKVWLRYVLVPGLTDDLVSIAALADFVYELGNIERVEVLPFHKMGEYKWRQLGLDYQLGNTPEPTKEQVNNVKRKFEKAGLLVY